MAKQTQEPAAPEAPPAKPGPKGPRKPRSAARTVVYVERLFNKFALDQRRAMSAMLRSVCEPTLTDGLAAGPNLPEDS